MDMTKFRPINTTAAAIADAVQKVKAAQTDLQSQMVQAKQERDALLLDGDTDALSKAERNLANAREDHERLDAVYGQLAKRLEAAECSEAIKLVEDAAADYAETDKARAAWWRREGPKIRKAMAEGLRLNDAAQAAAANYQHFASRLNQRMPEHEIAPLNFDQESNASEFTSTIHLWSVRENLEGGVA